MQPSVISRAALALLAFLLLVPSLPAAAQKAAEPPGDRPGGGDDEAGVFVERVNVNVVNVDVYVTDKRGHRVTGLGKDDFEVFEDGQPVAITNFYAVEGGRPVAAPQKVPAKTAEASGQPPGRAVPPQVEAPPREDQRLHLVVYVDNFNIRPQNRNRIMGDLRSFLLHRIGRDDRVMLVSYDRPLHIRQAFTSDPRLIASATMELEKISGLATMRDSERRSALDDIEDAQNEFDALGTARSYAESVENDLSFSIDALKEVVTSLAGLPGRKAILYVSDGLPMVAGEDLFHAVDERFQGKTTSLVDSFSYDHSRRFRELAALANANRVTFYTLDSTGLQVSPSISASERGPGLGTIIDSIRTHNLQEPLRFMADATGGKAIYNTNAVGAGLDEVADDFDTYYSLGYTPAHHGDGRFYKIDVKVKRKGLVVRHRNGYRDLAPETRMNDSTLAALHFPFERNPLSVSVELGDGTQRDDGYFVVPVDVKIPLGKVVLVPRKTSTREARLQVYVAAMDDKGGISPVQQVPLAISIPEKDVASAREKYYIYSLSLLMRRGEQKVAVGVRDLVSSESSFVSRTLFVGR